MPQGFVAVIDERTNVEANGKNKAPWLPQRRANHRGTETQRREDENSRRETNQNHLPPLT
jgi:hypothetical protein